MLIFGLLHRRQQLPAAAFRPQPDLTGLTLGFYVLGLPWLSALASRRHPRHQGDIARKDAHMARSHGKIRANPSERTPPFLLARDGAGAAVLIAPFPKRRRGPTPEELTIVQAVAEHLRSLPPQLRGAAWIDTCDGTVTPAAIGEGQLRRRLTDNASRSSVAS
jgi:hypothetical protein